MKSIIVLLSIVFITNDSKTEKPSKVDFDAYENLTKEVHLYRKNRLVNFDTFKKLSTTKGTIILDTRSAAMFDRKHINGAINLNFSDFTQENLAKIIPSENTRILIYCNNNIDDDQINFASKIYIPKKEKTPKEITLALNIPTFINLYGYGYQNVYELSELVSVNDNRIEFEGSQIFHLNLKK